MTNDASDRLAAMVDPATTAVLTMEMQRWAALCILQLLLIGLFVVAALVISRRPGVGGALLLVLHTGSQLFFLQAARDTDIASFYNEPPAAVTALSNDEATGWTVHGRVGNRFGPPPRGPFTPPDARTLWDERLRFNQGFPQAGALQGIAYDLDPTPEGLDAFLSVAFGQAMKQLRDEDRLRLLATTGVDRLVLDRPLDPAAAGFVVESHRVPGTPGPRTPGSLWIHRLPAASPVSVAGNLQYVGDINAALEALIDPASIPSNLAVLPGEGANQRVTPSALQVHDQRTESLTVEVDGEGGVLLWQRADLPIYRATIDGDPVEILPGNIHRIAVPLPPGHHTVRIWVDRRPLHAAIIAALAGIVLLGFGVRRASNTMGTNAGPSAQLPGRP